MWLKMRITRTIKLIIYAAFSLTLLFGITSFIDSDKTNKSNVVKIATSTSNHYHNNFFNSLNLSHSNQNFLILGFLIFLFVLFIKIKFLLPLNIIISVLIIGQIAIMVSGESGNAISNLHLFDPTEPVDEEKQKLLEAKKKAHMSEILKVLDSFPHPIEFRSYLYCQHNPDGEYDNFPVSCEESKKLCSKIKSISESVFDVGEKIYARLKDYKDHCEIIGQP